MPKSSRAVQLAFILTSFGAALFTPAIAQAQTGYFFEQPVVSASVRFGTGGPAANDDLFNFFTSQLTLHRSDFRGAAWAADLYVRAAPQVDLGIGYTYDSSNNRSEFNDWVDASGNAITQTTKLWRSSATVSARIYPLSRGRALGHHAWVPKTLNPYLLVGGGLMWYRLSQEGFFVRASDHAIITGAPFSDGSTGTFHAGGGAQWWATQHFGLSAEGRYNWGKATLDSDFADYNKIDLRGFQVTTGVSVRL